MIVLTEQQQRRRDESIGKLFSLIGHESHKVYPDRIILSAPKDNPFILTDFDFTPWAKYFNRPIDMQISVILNADMRGTNLSVLKRAFKQASWVNVDFRGANFSGVDFLDVDAHRVNFEGASLKLRQQIDRWRLRNCIGITGKRLGSWSDDTMAPPGLTSPE